MPKCAICLTRDANQTGSHMLSAFMIESTVGKRSEELGYIINEEPDFDYRKNTGAAPVVEDYIFCTGCEKRMSYIEGYICADYRDKIKNPLFTQNFTDKALAGYPAILRESRRINPLAFTLLVMSLLLRISLSKKLFHGFSLRPHEQETMRSILDQALPPYENFKVKIKLKNYFRELNAKAGLFEGFSYIFAIYDELDDPTTAFNWAHPEFRFPYNIMLGEVLILAFFEPPKKTGKFLDYFGFIDNLDIPALVNASNQPIRTLIVEKAKWIVMIHRVRDELSSKKIKRLMQKFTIDFINQNKRAPTDADWQSYVAKTFPED